MRFLSFKKHFEPFLIFSIVDIKKWDPAFDTRRLVEWQQKGYLRKIVNRWYVFSEVQFSVELLHLTANRIYHPSYISFESALAYHRLIPEGVYMVTSASSLKTRSFDTPFGKFDYRHLKPELMFGYELVEIRDQRYKMASPEKTLLDFLYLNPGHQTGESLEALRINFAVMDELLNPDTLGAYLSLYKNKALEKRVRLFNQVMKHA